MRARSEAGYTMVELLMVMTLLAFVGVGITAIQISGSRAESGLASTFQGQTSAHLGLNELRGDVHLACTETAQSATSVTLSLSPCDGTNVVTWCTRGSGSAYSLYRVTGSSCSGGHDWADDLTGGTIFTYVAPNSPSGSYAAARLHVDMTVNPTPTSTGTGSHLVDDLVFRNGARS
jgi:type II secretory pathway pseudopilin PulG